MVFAAIRRNPADLISSGADVEIIRHCTPISRPTSKPARFVDDSSQAAQFGLPSPCACNTIAAWDRTIPLKSRLIRGPAVTTPQFHYALSGGCSRRPHRRRCSIVCLRSAAQPQITKVEPPNWWTGFVSPVMVLLYGENLADAKISVAYPGVRIDKTQLQPDGKHAFVWLTIAKNAKPGNVPLTLKSTRRNRHCRAFAYCTRTRSRAAFRA